MGRRKSADAGGPHWWRADAIPRDVPPAPNSGKFLANSGKFVARRTRSCAGISIMSPLLPSYAPTYENGRKLEPPGTLFREAEFSRYRAAPPPPSTAATAQDRSSEVPPLPTRNA